MVLFYINVSIFFSNFIAYILVKDPMKNRRIIFILEPFEFPAGGVAVIYDHVEILSQNGFQAFVALPKKPSVDFYNSKAPMIIDSNIKYQEGDIYVIPEVL
jgi:hypothetical protein